MAATPAPAGRVPPPPSDRAETPLGTLYEEGFSLLSRGRDAERAGAMRSAMTFFIEGVTLFFAVLEREPDAAKRALVAHEVEAYRLAALAMQRASPSAPPADVPLELDEGDQTAPSPSLRAERAIETALAEDEAGRPDAELYVAAADALVQAISRVAAGATGEPERAALRVKLRAIIERAEELSGTSTRAAPASAAPASAAPTTAAPRALRGVQLAGSTDTTGSALYTRAELAVLRASSRIEGVLYLPFVAADLAERFALPTPFCDPDGLLPLSKRQRDAGARWARPSQFMRAGCAAPTMIALVSAHSIAQTLVSDCSFVASLAVAAQHERKFGRQLVTSALWPQDALGRPVANASGKYVVRLMFNGVHRKVVVDDRLPVSAAGELLCSHSANGAELWVSILEKAFLKLHGGYEFPGSTSSADLYMLTGGWIPESVDLADPVGGHERLWARLLGGLAHGDCLLTVATGSSLTDAEYDALGLVPGHAYAVLELREVLGRKLLLLKNPWAHKRWLGAYSPSWAGWTPELQSALNYDVLRALSSDSGVFFIDYASLRSVFARVHISWNPALFAHHTVVHDALAPAAPEDAECAQTLGPDPQFALAVRCGSASRAPTSLWLLLTRHISKRETERRDFLTLHVFADTAERVYYLEAATIEGTYINSVHFLVRIEVPLMAPAMGADPDAIRQLTVVVSQYERRAPVAFTLDAYATAPFTLAKIPAAWPVERRLAGRWTAGSAGGARNTLANPQYLLTLRSAARVQVRIEVSSGSLHAGATVPAVNVSLVRASARVRGIYTVDLVAQSKSYRPAFALADSLRVLEPGVFVIVASTFDAGQTAAFALTVALQNGGARGDPAPDFTLEPLD